MADVLPVVTDEGAASTRRVYLAAGRRLPSVTTLLGLPSQDVFIPWAMRQAVEAAWQHRAQPMKRSEYMHQVLATANERRDAKALKGTEVHKAVEKALAAEPDTVADDDHDPSALQALDFLAANNLRCTSTERLIANLDIGYAGTFDCLATTPDDVFWLIDWKTGRVSSKAFYQLMAYVNATHVWSNVSNSWVEHDLAATVETLSVVHLEPDRWVEYRYPRERWETEQCLEYLTHLKAVYDGECRLEKVVLPLPKYSQQPQGATPLCSKL